jgi:hypothetical protein
VIETESWGQVTGSGPERNLIASVSIFSWVTGFSR